MSMPTDSVSPPTAGRMAAGQLIVALYSAGGANHVAYMYADLLAVDLMGAVHGTSETVPCTVTAYQVRSSCSFPQSIWVHAF